MAFMKLKWNKIYLMKICGWGLFSSTTSEVLGFVEMARILDDCNSFLCIGVCRSFE